MHTPLARLLTLALLLILATQVRAGWDPDKEKNERKAAEEARAMFLKKDPDMKRFFDKAYAYVIFPSVGKGGIGIGGAYGSGLVYRKGKVIGRARLVQATIGFQLGGQVFSEIIFFKDKAAFDRFKADKLEFAAEASAVAITAGASAKADYSNGVAVFTMTRGGLMYEASIGGQSFTFEPL